MTGCNQILKEVGVGREEVCAIGDGEGDAGMFEAVGLAIGFHPHNSVSPFIHQKIYGESLIDMLRIIDDYERKTASIRSQTSCI